MTFSDTVQIGPTTEKNGAIAEQAPIFENANKMNKIYHI